MVDSSQPRGHGTPTTTPYAGVFRRRWGIGSAKTPALNLALQGGGAHGAYTWGVLDALLDQPGLSIDGVSGSSAGAMNAVVLAHGWMCGGPQGAKAALARFWQTIGQQVPAAAVQRNSHDVLELSVAAKVVSRLASFFSPHQLNPFDLNPLRDILLQQIDFARLRRDCPFKLFIGTTEADSGKLRLFREHELTVDVLLASACLPKIHHTVSIGGQAYWDGGFSANPAVFPLLHQCAADDTLLVLLNPLRHTAVPHSKSDIDARVTELGFTGHFVREMRDLAETRRLLRQPWGWLDAHSKRLLRARFHLVDTGHLQAHLQADTKMLAHGPFLDWLCAQGRQSGQQWLSASWPGVGRHDTVDWETLFT